MAAGQLSISKNFSSTPTTTCCSSGCYDNDVDYSTSQVERIKIEAALHRAATNLEKLDHDDHDQERIQMQSSGDCEACRQDLYRMAEGMFISHKVKLLSLDSFDTQLKQHLEQRDSITLVGEVVRSCLPPSATSQEVWRAMDNRMKEISEQCKHGNESCIQKYKN